MAARISVAVSLFALTAWGQSSEKLFYFAHLDSPQAMQDVSNIVKSIGDIRSASLDVNQRSLTVTGTAEQISLAGWLTNGLDNSGNASGKREVPFNDVRAPLVQIIYLTNVQTPVDLQEIVNALRSVLDVQRMFPMFAQKALVMRASPDQIKAADALISVLDQAAGEQNGNVAFDYRLAAAEWNLGRDLRVQLMPVPHLGSPQAMQEGTNLIRSIADIQRVFPINSRQMLLIRSSEDSMALANWLIGQLARPSSGGSREFSVAGPGNQIAEVVYVNATTAQGLQEMVNEIRQQAKILRVFPYNPQKAVALRGTSDQIAQANLVIQAARTQ